MHTARTHGTELGSESHSGEEQNSWVQNVAAHGHTDTLAAHAHGKNGPADFDAEGDFATIKSEVRSGESGTKGGVERFPRRCCCNGGATAQGPFPDVLTRDRSQRRKNPDENYVSRRPQMSSGVPNYKLGSHVIRRRERKRSERCCTSASRTGPVCGPTPHAAMTSTRTACRLYAR
jgi:hypothetical protein